MNNYKNAHLWLLIPFVIVMIGFSRSYWGVFTEAPWRHHLHGLTATAWFLLLIAQPYLITRGHAKRHRLFGMIGLILAGGVAFSGLGIIPYNLINERMPEVARYGLSFVDVILVPGFVFAVIMAIINSKRADDHARWMISTVFWVVSPGLFRVLFIPAFMMGVKDFDTAAPIMLAICGIVNLLILGVLMYRAKRAHPAYLAAALGSLVFFLPMVVGNMMWWRNLADAVFTV